MNYVITFGLGLMVAGILGMVFTPEPKETRIYIPTECNIRLVDTPHITDWRNFPERDGIKYRWIGNHLEVVKPDTNDSLVWLFRK